MKTFDCKQSANLLSTAFPATAWLFDRANPFHRTSETSTFYGFATEPTELVLHARLHYRLQAGMAFRVPKLIELRGAGVVIEKQNELSMFQIAGPVERQGRLKYIDGCSDTLIIAPIKMGDACLNHLHFPPGIQQTMHTHPTVRVGVVWRGSGVCVTPTETIPLVPGVGWFLPEGSPHCFHTADNTMDVIAWHPDTDTGPNDEDHPMLNRTYVDGTSARFRDDIRTK